jgi:hypothetical protein
MFLCQLLYKCFFREQIDKLPSTSNINLEENSQLDDGKESVDNESDIIKLGAQCRFPVKHRQVRFAFDPTPHFGNQAGTFSSFAETVVAERTKKKRRKVREGDLSHKKSSDSFENSPLCIASCPI